MHGQSLGFNAMNAQLRSVVWRILQTVPVVFGVVVISFVLTRALPGDPAVYFAGAMADAQSIEEVRVALGLDQPLWRQFFLYVGDLLQGDLGNSISTGQPVLTDLAMRLPASLELTLTALVIACAVAIPLGVLAAVRQGSWVAVQSVGNGGCVTAYVLYRHSVDLCFLLSAGCGAFAAGPVGFYLFRTAPGDGFLPDR